MNRILILSLALLGASNSHADSIDCGQVNILNFATGPRHGSMIQVSNPSCGLDGWVCLDPEAQYTSTEKSKRVFAYVLTHYITGKTVHVTAYDNVFPDACQGGYGKYPSIEDVRSN